MARKKVGKRIEEKKMGKKKENQLKLIVILMMVLVLSIGAFYFIAQELRKFSYGGVNFQKTKQGNILFYLANFPLSKLTGNVLNDVNIYFRTDPRQLESIPIEGGILLKKNVALAVNSDELICSDKVVAGTTLSQFLGRFGITTFGATTDLNEAKELNRTYVSCENASNYNYSVVDFVDGNTSRIMKVGNDCYLLEVAGCEIMNVTERFMIGVWSGATGIELK
jgi:hypothetical protein